MTKNSWFMNKAIGEIRKLEKHKIDETNRIERNKKYSTLKHKEKQNENIK